MGEVLDDDAGADAARADGGDERGEGGDLADVGELVEEAVHLAVEPLAGAGVGLPDGGLEEALVEDGGEEVEGGVGVREDDAGGEKDKDPDTACPSGASASSCLRGG